MNSNVPDTTRAELRTQRWPILIAEDDDLTRESLGALLRAEGYAIAEADTAEAALEQLSREFTPIVITDLLMPGIGGIGLCRQLRSQSFPGYVYVLVMTSSDAEDSAVEALRAGADDYISKRVSRAQLIARLQTAERIVSLEQRLRVRLDQQKRLASVDVLTGLINRRAFSKHFNAEFKRALRFSEDLALVLLDIDHFKSINDTYGHLAGDDVLREFAQRVRAVLPRPYDLFARLGGEEFVLLLPQTDVAGAFAVADRVRVAIAETPIAAGKLDVKITVSAGVSSLKERSEDGTVTTGDLMDRADQRLYASKRAGRNRVTASLQPTAPRNLSDAIQ